MLRHIILEQTRVGNFKPFPAERASCELMATLMRFCFHSPTKINGKLDGACHTGSFLSAVFSFTEHSMKLLLIFLIKHMTVSFVNLVLPSAINFYLQTIGLIHKAEFYNVRYNVCLYCRTKLFTNWLCLSVDHIGLLTHRK